MAGKVVLHPGWEADGVFIAEMQESPADVFIRRGVLVLATTGVLRFPYFVENRLLYVARRQVNFPDHDDAQKGQVRGESGRGVFA